MAGRLPLITFDVNETLLDLESVAPIFSRIFGDGAVMRLWFADLGPGEVMPRSLRRLRFSLFDVRAK
jgi:hypothetical protein